MVKPVLSSNFSPGRGGDRAKAHRKQQSRRIVRISLPSLKLIPPQSDSQKALLSAWGFRKEIVDYYASKGITTFFPWQVECLQKPAVIERHRNLVYSAPPSAGKTMVADALVFKTLLELHKKAIFVVPYVSIAQEKVHSLKPLFRELNLRIEAFSGRINPPGGLTQCDFAVCSIEKASSLVNR